MRCPACGVYHPPLYEECVSCGAKLGTANLDQKSRGAPARQPDSGDKLKDGHDPDRQAVTELEEPGHHASRKSKVKGHGHHAGLPTAVGVLLAILILLVSAGATIFFLTKPPDYERLYQQGQHELANGQYAFAVKTLERAVALRPQDSRMYLALARAYVGIDQIEKAWQC